MSPGRAPFQSELRLSDVYPLSAERYLLVLSFVFLILSVPFIAPTLFFGAITGAILIPEEMGEAQGKDPSAVVLPFDLRYWAALKVARIAKEQPEVVSIGSSRGMELRSATFAPYRFYNASLTAWTLDQEVSIIDQITRVSRPRVIIVGIDYFMFTDRYADAMARDRSMEYENGIRFRVHSCADLLREFWKQPLLAGQFFDDWRQGKSPTISGSGKLLGVHAIRNTTGFRSDGSMLVPSTTYDAAAAKLAANEGILKAAPGAFNISDRQYKALERLAALGRDRGVELVAVQWPIHHGTVDFLDNDVGYHDLAGIWRQFESPDMRRRMEALGFIFFDMSRDPMNGNGEFFIDAAHPTEAGMSVAISHLLEQPRFRALFPDINADRLRADHAAAIARGDKFEVYGN
jgi:hypothetical protein